MDEAGGDLARNRALVRAQLLRDVDEGVRFLEQRAAGMLPGLQGRLLASLASRSVAPEVRRRAQRQVEAVLVAARAHGEAPAALYDAQHFGEYLAHDEAWTRADRAHARFAELEALVRERYRARVEPVALLLHRGRGASYPALVRSVFAERAHAADALGREYAFADQVMLLAEREPALVRAPPVVGSHALRILRETHEWYRQRLHRSLDEVYGAPGAPA